LSKLCCLWYCFGPLYVIDVIKFKVFVSCCEELIESVPVSYAVNGKNKFMNGIGTLTPSIACLWLLELILVKA
jgi:hypothetical protein